MPLQTMHCGGPERSVNLSSDTTLTATGDASDKRERVYTCVTGLVRAFDSGSAVLLVEIFAPALAN